MTDSSGVVYGRLFIGQRSAEAVSKLKITGLSLGFRGSLYPSRGAARPI
jgi:hypothetical protein